MEDSQNSNPEPKEIEEPIILDEGAGVTESGVRLVLEMTRSTARGVNHLAPGGQPHLCDNINSPRKQRAVFAKEQSI